MPPEGERDAIAFFNHGMVTVYDHISPTLTSVVVIRPLCETENVTFCIFRSRPKK